MKTQIEKGIAILKNGGLVAYPTDTVYGLGASAMIPEAAERVFRVKERPLNMPLPLLLSDESQIPELAEAVSPVAWLMVRRFMPGALTLVLSGAGALPEIILGGGNTVAVRIPAHPVPLALIEGLGGPLIGTSANLSGRPSALTAEEAAAQLGDRIDLVIDGGACPGGRESTVLDVTGETPLLLREGAIPVEEIERVCGCIILREV